MVNDEGIPRFFLAVSVMVLIPPFINHLTFSCEADLPCRAHRPTRDIYQTQPLGVFNNTPRARC